MTVIEFEARVDNGSISVPEKYRGRLTGLVRVRVVHQEKTSDENMIDELLERPLRIADFRPLTRDEIYARE